MTPRLAATLLSSLARQRVPWLMVAAGCLGPALTTGARDLGVSSLLPAPTLLYALAGQLAIAVMLVTSVAAAALIADARGTGMLMSLHLAGAPPRAYAVSSWLAAVLAGVCVGIGAVLLVLVGLGVYALGHHDSLSSWQVQHEGPGLSALALQAGAALVAGSGVGLAVGRSGKTATSAAATASSGVAGLVALSYVAPSFPVLEHLYDVTPLGAAALFTDDALSPAELLAGSVTVLVYAVVLPVGAVLALTGEVTLRTPTSHRQHRRSSSTAWLGGIVGLLGVGFVVPTGLRGVLPWYLSPAWIAQSAAGRNSEDVARRFLEAASSRTDDPSTHAPGTTPHNILGLYQRFVTHSAQVEVHVAEHLVANPGDVSVVPRYGRPFQLCMAYEEGRWLVKSLRTSADCPRPRFP